MPRAKLKYKRILLKVSGEVFAGAKESVLDGKTLMDFAKDVKKLQKLGAEVGIVVGGGNIWRYRDNKELKLGRVTSDVMGMMATVMNALALESALKEAGVDARAMSAFPAEKAMENYVPKRARAHMDKGKVVIFAGGTGNPFFTTDSAAALRALEMDCDVLMKATKVDYVYDKDPVKYKNAKKFDRLSFDQVLDMELGVMDMTCASLCRDGGLKMLVFNFSKKGILEKAVKGAKVGTIIS